MNYQQNDQNDTWAGLIPEQPKEETPLAVWLGVAAVVAIILCLCAGGSFLIYNQFIAPPTAVPPPVVPTIAGQAWITGIFQHGLDPSDPFRGGYTLPDLWFA